MSPTDIDNPAISVVVAAHGGESHLPECLDSLLSQTRMPCEIIVCEGGLGDAGQRILADYASRYPNLIKALPPAAYPGKSANLNEGLKVARGAFVSVIAALHLWVPGKLEREFRRLLETDSAWAYSRALCMWGDVHAPDAAQPFSGSEAGLEGDVFEPVFTRDLVLSDYLVRRDVLQDVGMFDGHLDTYYDWDLSIRISKHYPVAHVDDYLVVHRQFDKEPCRADHVRHLAEASTILRKNSGLFAGSGSADLVAAQKRALEHIGAQSGESGSAEESAYKLATASLSLPYPHRPSEGRGEEVIFLISLPRSGSTLLQRILAGHPDVHSMSEPWIMLHPMYALRHTGWTADFDEHIAAGAVKDFVSALGDGDSAYYEAVRMMGTVLYRKALSGTGKTFFLDKTPRYYEIIGELKQAFPRAKFVFLLRNPLAVFSSVVNSWFKADPSSVKNTPYYDRDLLQGPSLIAEGIELLGDGAAVVRYEDLVADPEQTVRRLCEDLGLAYFPPMLHYGSTGAVSWRLGDQANLEKHEAPVCDYADRWKTALRDEQLGPLAAEYLESVGEGPIERLGYSYREMVQVLAPHHQQGSVAMDGSSGPEAGDEPTSRMAGGETVADLNTLGEQLAGQGKYEEAKEFLLEALRESPNDPEVLNNLGVVYWELGDYAEALSALARALMADPSHQEAASNLERIREVLSEAAQSGPTEPDAGGLGPASAGESYPKITVITPSFNQAATLEETIVSVLRQGYPNLEYIVVDGGSTDGSKDVIKRYEQHIDYWVSEPDRGQSHAINKGLERATGDLVVWLNSDDFFYPGALQTVAQAYAADPSAGLYVGNGTLVDAAGSRIRRYSNGVAFDFEVLLRGSNFILQPSTFINRRALEDVGFIDESLIYAMDLDLWLRIGRSYPVVTIDQELSAYRWSDTIKTASGGIGRWVEQWNVVRRYADVQLTPGLLVEFFNVLKEDAVVSDVGLEGLQSFAEGAWQAVYQSMQALLNTRDCIPVNGSDRKFEIPVARPEDVEPVRAEEPAAPAVISERGMDARIDIVLPQGHSWFVREGYVEALKTYGALGRAFFVGGPSDTAELYRYLKNPKSDAVFLMNTEWHARYLHDSEEWRARWDACAAKKVLFSFECMNNPLMKQAPAWWADTQQALADVRGYIDAVVFAHEPDEALFAGFGVPVLWQAFAVDETLFGAGPSFSTRHGRAFFKGKVTPFYSDRTYRTRRALLERLRRYARADVFDSYEEQQGNNLERMQRFIGEMQEYQIVLGLPSLSPTMVVRAFEAMAAGSVFFQNEIMGQRSRELFQDGQHLIVYDENDPEGLVNRIDEVLEDPERAELIARTGQEEVLTRHTIRHRVAEVLDWLGSGASRPDRTAQRDREVDRPTATGDASGSIVIDGVIFFLQRAAPGGISRVWHSLLEELGRSELAEHIVLLDRAGTAPSIPGIRKRVIEPYDYQYFEDDSLLLQQVCEEERCQLFVSTYYSYPEQCHSLLMLHDMVPELCGEDLQHPEWRAKEKAIKHAQAYVSVSQSTARDFRKLYPELADRKLYMVPNAADGAFRPRAAQEAEAFRRRYGIEKPYFLVVGKRLKYKNAILFFKALSLLENRSSFEVVCTGGGVLEPMFKPYVDGVRVHAVAVGDDELAAAYAGAVALVYPSQYEGFGLPVLEAMRCDCPVITCRNSSLPEVAGDAALFVDAADVSAMVAALKDVQRSDIRARMIERGRRNAARFTWANSGAELTAAIRDAGRSVQGLPLRPIQPLHTGGRLIAGLERRLGRTPVVAAMSTLKQMYTGWVALDLRVIAAAEDAIAAMDDRHLATLREAVESGVDCDAFVHYWLGLALAYQQDTMGEALQAFGIAIERHDWVAGYRWRVAERAADLAMSTGHPELAVELLKGMVLAEFPTHPEATGKLSKAEAALTAGPGSAAIPAMNSQRNSVPETAMASNPQAGIAGDGPEPLVSVIVSVYNADNYLAGCLEDLEAQTMADRIEIIVVDSGSSGNEADIVREFQHQHQNIRYLRTEQRESVYGAWNRAIEAARGRYITNANADDRHAADAIEKLAAVLDADPDIGVAYGDCAVTRTPNSTLVDGDIVGRFRWPDFDRTRLFQVCYIGPQPMWRRTLHEQYGLFDASLECAGDYDFWLRVSDKTEFRHLPEVLGLYLQSPGSIEHRDPGTAALESEAVRERHWPANQGQRPPVEGNFLELYVADAYVRQSDGWPLVSVVIPTRNRPAELSDALNSVLGQSYPNIEIVVVNDGGEDIRGAIDRLSTTRPVKHIINEVARGTSAARNIGLRNANGKYIAFLDDDDVFRPLHIATLVAELEADSRLVAAYSDGLQVNVDFATEPPQLTGQVVQYSEDFSADELLVRNYIPNLCVVARRSAVEKAGPFDETLSALEDWEWLIRLSRVGRFSHLPIVTVEYVARTGGPSRNWLDIDDIADLYRRIYSGGDHWADMAVRERQNAHFSAMTGRELERRDPARRDQQQLRDTGGQTAGEGPDVIAIASGTVYSNEHRIGLPLSALERRGLARTRVLRSERPEDTRAVQGRLLAASGAVLLAHNVTDDQGIEAMSRFRDRNEGVIVYSQDALTLDVPAYSALSRSVPRDIKKRVRRALRLCDRLVVPTPAMAEAYRDMIGDIRVVPNYLSRAPWENLRSQRRRGERLRVGWAGLPDHTGDLEVIVDVVKETADEVQWVFFGLCFEEWLAYGVEVHDGVDFQNYPETLASLNLDLAVAPLTLNRFNECRSNLKLLEYGALGIPVVCTDVEPFRNGPVARVRNTKSAWLRAIRERMANPDALGREGDELQAWVLGNWMLEDHLDQWAQALAPDRDVVLAKVAGQAE